MSSSWSWRSETEGRLRKAEVSLEAARALIERKPPCIDDAVNRASAAALQAARALVDARWPPRETEPAHDPTWRPGMTRQTPMGPYTKASWHEIVKQFEKAAHEMVLPSDATEYLKALVEDGHIADNGEAATWESDEALEAVRTAEKLVKSVGQTLPLAFALGQRETEGPPEPDDEEDKATTMEMMPVVAPHHHELAAASPTDPHLPEVAAPMDNETVMNFSVAPAAEAEAAPPKADPAEAPKPAAPDAEAK